MKFSLRLLTLLLLGAFAGQTSSAQGSYNYWSLGLSVATMHYQGDLDDHGFQPWIGLTRSEDDAQWGSPIDLLRPGFGFQANYHFNPHMFVGFNLNYGWIGADETEAVEPARQFRRLHFQNQIFEASALFNYEFFASDRHYRFRPNWSPFVFFGVALFYHNPYTELRLYDLSNYLYTQGYNGFDENNYQEMKAILDSDNGDYSAAVSDAFEQYYENDERVYLQPLRTEGQGLRDNTRPDGDPQCKDCADDPYSLLQFAIPVGIGVRRKLTDKLDLRFSVGLRKTFTDHIDDVGSIYYPDPDIFFNRSPTTDDPALSYLLTDRSRYRETVGGFNAHEVQRNIESQPGSVITEDNGGEFRGWTSQDDWFGTINLTLTYILDRGDRCPKFK